MCMWGGSGGREKEGQRQHWIIIIREDGKRKVVKEIHETVEKSDGVKGRY